MMLEKKEQKLPLVNGAAATTGARNVVTEVYFSVVLGTHPLYGA